MDRARDLLQAELAPAHTALRTGFCDQSHFSNVFRRYIGVSPGTYAASVRHSIGSAADG
ncbi:MAG: helix-turn-helix transcriptional regulator [Clostridia bacterium]|nr:helix-turn-helix transcriptional regulator [Clostridia bacterium]